MIHAEKDCIEDASFLQELWQMNWLVCHAINVKARRAEVVKVFRCGGGAFKRGFYTVDIKFFIRVTLTSLFEAQRRH